MARFVVGDDRSQSTLFPERLDDYLVEDNPVRAIDVFVDELDLAGLGFGGVEPAGDAVENLCLRISQPGAVERGLERECQRNIELVWLTGRLMPDFKTIADFRKDNGQAIRKVCGQFVVLSDALSCSARRVLRSTAASSKPSTRGTVTSPRPRCSGGWRRLTRELPAISRSSTAPIARGKQYRKPRSRG